MRNPSDTRFKKIQRLHQTGQMIGFDRPVGRATWTKTPVHSVLSAKPGEGRVRFLNKLGERERELWTVRTIDIDRSIGQDAATCTLTLWNYHAATMTEPEGSDTEGSLGYYSPGRGVKARNGMKSVYTDPNGRPYPTSWGYAENKYRDVFIPNTIIKTYQGYGSDNFDEMGEHRQYYDPLYVPPEDDKHLYRTGVWLIDKVTYGTDGQITLECRDFAKLLIEQVIYPPLLPLGRFPLRYHPAHKASGHKESIGRSVASFMASSADRHYGANTPIHGHRGSDAFDSPKVNTFWLSPGNDSPDAVEWLQAHISGPINELNIHAIGGNYVAYISVYENGKWQGKDAVPGSAGEYDGDEGFRYVIASGDTLWDLAGRYYGNNLLWPRIAKVNNNISDPHWIFPGQRIKIPYITGTNNPPPTGQVKGAVPYVKRVTIPGHTGKNGITIRLPRTYKARRLRVTFTRLAHLPGHNDYRVGIWRLHARHHIRNTYKASTIKAGYIDDWSEAIKELCAWGGFTWPDARPNPPDPLLGRSQTTFSYPSGGFGYPSGGGHGGRLSNTPMRVWGDFERLGAGPIVSTDPDYFMNKSFMEGIRQVVDFIGGIFYVDESAGAQFRMTNIWSGGNFIDDPEAPASLGAKIKDHPIEFRDDTDLVTYSTVIDDTSLRSEILVVGGYPNTHSTSPIAGGYVTGYNSATKTTSAIDFTNILAGQYRLMQVPGDSTKLFKTQAECQRMAELTALFILFTYRQGTVHAPAHPGLQIDDQVTIYERITNEQNIHYVSGIRTRQDLDTGEYTMDVTTHWLGKDPDHHWLLKKAQLTPAVKRLPAIIARLGKSDTGSTDITGAT